MLVEQLEYVVGVDTHKRTHTAAVVVAGTGGVVEQLTVTTDTEGYTRLLEKSESRKSIVRSVLLVGTVPRPTNLMLSEPRAKRCRESTWPNPGGAVIAKLCASFSRRAMARCELALRLSANSRHWWSMLPKPYVRT